MGLERGGRGSTKAGTIEGDASGLVERWYVAFDEPSVGAVPDPPPPDAGSRGVRLGSVDDSIEPPSGNRGATTSWGATFAASASLTGAEAAGAPDWSVSW